MTADIRIRKAEMRDLEAMLEIEASAIPGYGYLEEAKDFLIANIGNEGEMILAEADGVPAGMGRYSILPDGSGWLEILRVRKEYQRQGIGRAIYRRYMELAEETDAPSVAMFTGRRNIASRSLAELYGFAIAADYSGYDLDMEEAYGEAEGFRPVPETKEAAELIGEAPGCGPFMCFNRTFMHWGMPLYEYLTKRGMVYTDGESVLILGWRMLEKRGLHIGYMDGDLSRCMAFAVQEAKRRELPKVSYMFPRDDADKEALMAYKKCVHTGDLIVMEKKIAQ